MNYFGVFWLVKFFLIIPRFEYARPLANPTSILRPWNVILSGANGIAAPVTVANIMPPTRLFLRPNRLATRPLDKQLVMQPSMRRVAGRNTNAGFDSEGLASKWDFLVVLNY